MSKILNLTVVGVLALLLILEGALLERGGLAERFGLFPRSPCSRADRARRILESTLPDVRIVVKSCAISPNSAYKENYSFTEDWFFYSSPVWEVAMAAYKGKPGLRYLEIGVFEGRSIIWMLENILTDPTSGAVGIDPFLDDYKDRYRANLTRSGQESRVTTIVGYSQVELRKLPLDSFDFIYVDGSHAADDVLEDAVLSLRLLKKGGILIFDDYGGIDRSKTGLPETTPRLAVDVFYAMFSRQLEVIHNGWQAIFTKK